MSNANGKILKKMLEQSYDLQADNEAKEVYIRNLQDFLCAGLATENVACIPKLRNGGLCLTYELDSVIHECPGDLLSTALKSYEEKNYLYSLPQGVQRTALSSKPEREPVVVPEAKEVASIKPVKKQKEPENTNPEVTEVSPVPVQTQEEENVEVNNLPTCVKITMEQDAREKELILTWDGSADFKVMGAEHKILNKDEEMAQIKLCHITQGDVVKILFSRKVSGVDYELIPEQEEAESTQMPKGEEVAPDIIFPKKQLEYIQYEIVVDDRYQNQREEGSIRVIPLERKEGAVKIMVTVEDEEEKRVYASPSASSTTAIDYIRVGSHSFQIEAQYENGELTADIYGRGDTNNDNRYDISLEEKKVVPEDSTYGTGHPVWEKDHIQVHVFPYGEKWEEDELPFATVLTREDGSIEIPEENGQPEQTVSFQQREYRMKIRETEDELIHLYVR